MKRHHPSHRAPALFFFSLFLAAPVLALGTPATSFVQATIVASDAVHSTVTYVDASGRQRTERATGDAAANLAHLRPGDEAIVERTGGADGLVVTRVRLSHAEAAPVAAPDGVTAVVSPGTAPATPVVAGAEAATAPVPATPSVPMRRSWPNPFAKPRPTTTGQ